MPGSDPLSELAGAVAEASATLRGGTGSGPPPSLDRPPKPEMGDYSTNAAMLLAAPLGESPRAVAERLREDLAGRLGDRLDRAEVAGPGFLNLYLSERWHREALAALGTGIEPARAAAPERVLVEFVSANPTGPLTAAGGRHAAFGDSISRLLEATGHEVWREYYVNDAGSQIERFAASIAAQMTGGEVPDGGYEGEYVAGIGSRLSEQGVDPGNLGDVGSRGVELMLEQIRASLHRYGVDFDAYFSERTVYASGGVEAAISKLRERGHIYDSDGAVWLRSTTFGDDKDRVLIRANGEPTYLGPDLAYHANKLDRGYDRLLDVWGADHHGYILRMRAALEALGTEPEAFEVVIMQLVHLIESGERAQMSKRRGDFVTLDELVDDIGVDAARFFMLQRAHETTLDLDLDLARSQSSENPVYYVQYAHARIASILRKAGQESEGLIEDFDPTAEASGLEPAERTLIKRLLEFPNEVCEAAERRAPHRLCAYAMTVAADFHSFYRDCQVVGAEGPGTEQTRLLICHEVKRTIAETLGLLGISAPERM